MTSIRGRIIKVFERTSGVSSRGEWESQEFLLEDNSRQYARKALFSVFGKDLLNELNLKEGDSGEMYFNVEAREYKGRWYNTLRCWKFKKNDVYVDKDGNGEQKQDEAPKAEAPVKEEINVVDTEDVTGLPF